MGNIVEKKTYPVCETQITWLQIANVICNSLFVIIALASAKPNNEWSVKTVFKPIVLAWNIASCAKAENAYRRNCKVIANNNNNNYNELQKLLLATVNLQNKQNILR